MNSIQDRAQAILNDLKADDLNTVSISDAEQIFMQMTDKWDAMSFLRAFGAAHFAATTSGVSKKAKEAALKNLESHLNHLL
jgi:hypothetical protein